MSVTMHKPQVGTSWWGDFAVDTLVIPAFGAADVDVATITGSLAPKLLSCVYGTNQYTLTFQPNTLQTWQSVDVELEVGTSTLLDVVIQTINLATQQMVVDFFTPAGVATGPPIVATGAKVHLFIPRLNPVT